MSETLLGLVVLASVGGAILNTIRGWKNTSPPEAYNFKEFLAAFIPSIFVGIVLGQNVFTTLPDGIGWLAAILTALTAGFGVDYAITKGKTN